ncbi:MAG: thymidine kinase [Alphaproteobacteria bacterium]|nr:thymidine kinase [Alphaproteobacteria bacterium]
MAKLYFNYSAMNAGKSTTLLQASFNYRERGMRTLVYTAAVDDRVAKGVVASRIGLEGDARVYDDAFDLFADVCAEHAAASVACVFVDEAQFLRKKHVLELAAVVDQLAIPVLCYGLRTDFRGDLFEGSQWLLALADEISELKTICACGAKATMNLRVDRNGRAVREGEKIEIGGDDRYTTLCRRHFFEKFSGGGA